MPDTKIFISHRSTDKQVANILFRFFTELGIDGGSIFCSSLPGNDVETNISAEIKSAISNSTIDIVILSADYYESAYCLNEAGIIWYKTREFNQADKNSRVITVALPEISCGRMIGFLNDEFKIKRLDNTNDLATICDITFGDSISARSFSAASERLRNDYIEYIANRKQPTFRFANEDIKTFQTDAERIILYYMLTFETFRVDKSTLTKWANSEEIYDINFGIGLELLEDKGLGTYLPNNASVFSLDSKLFSDLLNNKERHLSQLQLFVDDHKILSSEIFDQMWNLNRFDNNDLLFLLYLIENNNQQLSIASVEAIKKHYEKSGLHIAGFNFDSSLNKFIKNGLLFKLNDNNIMIPQSFYKILNNFKYKPRLEQIKDQYHIRHLVREFHT